MPPETPSCYRVPAPTNNIIEENYLTNGNTRIYLYGGASGNHIRSNELKMNRS